MSMKKFTKKMLAIVAAVAMTMGMAMPAFAADPSSAQDTKNNAKEAYIKKTYNTEVKKEMTFTFAATQVKDASRDDLVKTDLTCDIPNIKFEAADLNSGAGTYTKLSDTAITFGTLEEAGKYEYTVTESATTNPVVTNNDYEKLIMSQAEYKMDVYVVEKSGKLEIDKILVTKTKNDKGDPDTETGKVDIGKNDSNGFNFTNTYVQEAGTGETPDPTDPDPNYTENGALKVSKTIDVQGETPSDSASFSFTAKFVFPEGTDAATLGGVKGNGADVSLTGGTYEFNLKHGQNMKFTGLPVGTKITVTETGAANYKASASFVLNGGTATTRAAGKYHEDLTVVTDGKLGQKTNTVDVTNTYNYVPTTGIIMNTLPYVLMVALCAAALFGFVAFKRKKVQK